MFTEQRHNLLSGLTWRRERKKKKKGRSRKEQINGVKISSDYTVLLTTCVSRGSAKQKRKIYWQTNLQTETNPLENFEDLEKHDYIKI